MPMRISIDVDDATTKRVVDAFTNAYGYQPKVPDPAFDPALPENAGKTAPQVDNPETAEQFVRRRIRDYVREVVAGYEATKAADKARDTARKKAETEVLA